MFASDLVSTDHCSAPLTEIEAFDEFVVSQLLCRFPFERDLTMHDNITAISYLDRLVEVLLRHQHGKPQTLLTLADYLDHPTHHNRRKTDRWLVD